MNKNIIWTIAGIILGGLALLWLGYQWGQQQTSSSSLFSSYPLPSIHQVPKKPLNELFNGLTLHSSLITPESKESATIVRSQPENYRVDIILHAVLPQSNLSIEQLSKLVPALPEVLPNLKSLLSNAKISPAFTTLYQNKVNVLRQNLFYLERAVSRQNFYDCETLLHLQNPATGRRAILGIGPMDVNTDGSDGDRNVLIDKSSFSFQPTTSYRWPKTSNRFNPFVKSTEKELAQIKQDLAIPQTSEKISVLKQQQELLTYRLRELKRWSFLASTADPFIVLPEFFFRKYSGPFAPKIGDFALVLYAGTAYPAIVGDAGPFYKFGEASLRICRQINKSASGVNRAVNHLRVAYLVFPDTAIKPQTPDLNLWNARCASLLEEFGGNHKMVFQWKNNIPPWPSPTLPPVVSGPSITPGISTPSTSPTSIPNTSATPTPSTPSSPFTTPTSPISSSPLATPNVQPSAISSPSVAPASPTSSTPSATPTLPNIQPSATSSPL